jgi:hypothetical protein
MKRNVARNLQQRVTLWELNEDLICQSAYRNWPMGWV